MANRIKKGAEVWLFGKWSRDCASYVYRITLTSMGKQQGTATRIEDGKNCEFRIYSSDLDRMVPVSEMADPTEYALEFSRRLIETEIAYYVRRLEFCREREAAGLPHAFRIPDVEKDIEIARALKPKFAGVK